MRVIAATGSSTNGAGASQRRKGVILLVVIAFLTLFAIVGTSFVFYADTGKHGTTQFREEAAGLAEDTGTLAAALGRDLMRLDRENVDLRPHLETVDDLEGVASALRGRVLDARERATDAEVRGNLDKLIRDIEIYEELLQDLRCILREILHGD